MNPQLLTLNGEWLTVLCWIMLMVSVVIMGVTLWMHALVNNEPTELFQELDCRLM